ncbi:MAG TPA: hypothetical protein VIZ31_00510, partial [Vicinamibacteria bacterium]
MGRSSASGYQPLVPRRTRDALVGMNEAGLLPGAFFRASPTLLERLGIRVVQVPMAELSVPADAAGLGEVLDLPLEAGRPRLLPTPRAFATEVHLATWMADAVGVPQGQPVAEVIVRLASGRELRYPLRAGVETAEWALERADVRPLVRHRRPRVYSSFREPGQDFDGHRYLAVLDLHGRYLVDGLRLQRGAADPGQLYLHRAGTADGPRQTGLSLVSAYVSDLGVLREIPAVPSVRLYSVRGGFGLARVVDQVRVARDHAEARQILRHDPGFDPRREAVLGDLAFAELKVAAALPGARARRAEVKRVEGGRIAVLAEGPGLLVVNTTWDPGWRVRVSDGPITSALRVNEVQTGVLLGPGPQRVSLRYVPRGFREGLAVAGLAGLGLLAAGYRARRREV